MRLLFDRFIKASIKAKNNIYISTVLIYEMAILANIKLTTPDIANCFGT